MNTINNRLHRQKRETELMTPRLEHSTRWTPPVWVRHLGLPSRLVTSPDMGRTIPARSNIIVMESPYQVVLRWFQGSSHHSACPSQFIHILMHSDEHHYGLCLPCTYLQKREGDFLYEYCNAVDDDLDVDIFLVKDVLLQILTSIEVHCILTVNTTTASLDVRQVLFLQVSADNLFMCFFWGWATVTYRKGRAYCTPKWHPLLIELPTILCPKGWRLPRLSCVQELGVAVQQQFMY